MRICVHLLPMLWNLVIATSRFHHFRRRQRLLYALEKAMLALAPGCVAMPTHSLEANADNGPGTARMGGTP